MVSKTIKELIKITEQIIKNEIINGIIQLKALTKKFEKTKIFCYIDIIQLTIEHDYRDEVKLKFNLEFNVSLNLEIFQVIDNLCSLYNIKYNVIGNTCFFTHEYKFQKKDEEE